MAAHPMRRMDREMEPDECRSLLGRGRFSTLGLADADGCPYVVTLSYGFDADASRLYFHVARAGRKLDLAAANPRAAATVVDAGEYLDGRCAHPYESVVLEGRLRLVEDDGEREHALRTVLAQQESDAEAAWTRNHLDDPATWRRFAVLAFDIESSSGKRGS